jgi:phenylpyruvate tautomerase
MPFFSITTNEPMDAERAASISAKASAFLAGLLGKPEKYIMVQIRPGEAMILNQNSEPTAFVELKSIGLAKDDCRMLSEKICGFLEERVGISPERAYIDFHSIDGAMFGWNKTTF